MMLGPMRVQPSLYLSEIAMMISTMPAPSNQIHAIECLSEGAQSIGQNESTRVEQSARSSCKLFMQFLEEKEPATTDNSTYTDKQKRQAEHIEKSADQRGLSKPEAVRRAWATKNKTSGDGKKNGSGRKQAKSEPGVQHQGASGAVGATIQAAGSTKWWEMVGSARASGPRKKKRVGSVLELGQV